MQVKPIHRDLLALGGIAAVVVIFFYKFVFFGMIPLNAEWLTATFLPWKAMMHSVPKFYFNGDVDPVIYMYPIKYVTIQIMKTGHLPLWNPYILCGAPLWGTNFSTPLNPLNFVFFILDFAKAWGVFLMLQFMVAGIGTYLFSRAIGIVRAGAIIAAVAFMLNGTFIVFFETIGYVGVYSWMPLVFFLAEKTFQRSSLLYAFWCGVTIALFFCSGIIQIAVYAAVFSLAYIIYRFCQCVYRGVNSVKMNVLCVVTIMITAFIYMLPEISVQLTNIINSARTFNRYGLTILYPQMLISFISPIFYGIKYDGWDLGYGAYIFNRGFIRLSPPYIGILPIFLAVTAFFYKKNKDRVFYLLASFGIIAALMSFAFPVVYKTILKVMPFFGCVDHYRLVTIYTFAMAVMAGMGCSALAQNNGDKRLHLKVSVIFLVLISCAFFLLQACVFLKSAGALQFITRGSSALPAFFFEKSHSLKSLSRFIDYLSFLNSSNRLLLFSKEVMIPMAGCVMAVALIALAVRSKLSRIWQSAMVVFVCVDILYFALCFPAYSVEKNVYPMTPCVRFLKEDTSLYRVLGYTSTARTSWGDVFPPNTNILFGLQEIRGHENIGQAPWYYRFISGDHPSGDIVGGRSDVFRSKYLSALNVKYIVSDRELAMPYFEKVYDNELKIYKNQNVMPRAYIVKKIRYAGNADEACAIMRSEDFDPTREAVVEAEPGSDERFNEPGSGGVVYPESISYSAGEVVVRTNGKDAGALILADAFFPGWRVRVDGVERRVLKANYAFRAVMVHRGDSQIRFYFRPPFLPESLGLCAFLAVLAALFSVVRFLRGRSAL